LKWDPLGPKAVNSSTCRFTFTSPKVCRYLPPARERNLEPSTRAGKASKLRGRRRDIPPSSVDFRPSGRSDTQEIRSIDIVALQLWPGAGNTTGRMAFLCPLRAAKSGGTRLAHHSCCPRLAARSSAQRRVGTVCQAAQGEMREVFVIEIGCGSDLHGQDVTKAAVKACEGECGKPVNPPSASNERSRTRDWQMQSTSTHCRGSGKCCQTATSTTCMFV